MHEHNLFGLLARVARNLPSDGKGSSTGRQKTLRPESNFFPFSHRLKYLSLILLKKTPFMHKIIRQTVIYIFILFEKILNYYRLMTSDFYRSHHKWITDHPKSGILYEYDLSQYSNVLDVGGFAGDFAANIIEKYNPYVTIFEPIPQFAASIEMRFAREKKIRVIRAGLSDRDEQAEFSLDADATGFFDRSGGDRVPVILMDASKFLKQSEVREWDLVKLNIEGAEYALLDHLIDTGHIQSIRYLQVQFHLHVPEAKSKYAKLASRLQNTHKLQWRYPFVWESWVRHEGIGGSE